MVRVGYPTHGLDVRYNRRSYLLNVTREIKILNFLSLSLSLPLLRTTFYSKKGKITYSLLVL